MNLRILIALSCLASTIAPVVEAIGQENKAASKQVVTIGAVGHGSGLFFN